MKYLSILFGAVYLSLMLLLACAPAPEPEPEVAPEPVFDQAAEETAIREVVKQVYVELNKHDVETFTAFYDEYFSNWSGSVEGRAAWKKYAEGLFERAPDFHSKLLDEIGIVFVTPDVAIYKDRHEVSGRVNVNGNTLPPLERLGAYVYVKKNGKWSTAAQFFRPIE